MKQSLVKDEHGVYHIRSRDELRILMKELGLRWDWHEPDEQRVEAIVFGNDFDNAGFWGRRFRGQREDGYMTAITEEMNVLLVKDDKPVAEINLATLFSWACVFDD